MTKMSPRWNDHGKCFNHCGCNDLGENSHCDDVVCFGRAPGVFEVPCVGRDGSARGNEVWENRENTTDPPIGWYCSRRHGQCVFVLRWRRGGHEMDRRISRL